MRCSWPLVNLFVSRIWSIIWLSPSLWWGTIPGLSTLMVILCSDRNSLRFRNHMVSRYVRGCGSSSIGVPVPAVCWFHMSAIRRCCSASVFGVLQCLISVSILDEPCSCFYSLISMPPYFFGPYITPLAVFLLYPSFGRNILVVLLWSLSKAFEAMEFTGKLYSIDGRYIPW